ncbi:ABC transporter substrate-binding protein [Candidatus Parabeggiatoa sp. HSG14]|uniref:ABC transporter substrate-binding protein n=1 Tax=Candidatus Parabeggiatoa sp. HSG14 TaxID=3055593 RepID=UPI0025A71D30|nr:ABC transporter substrate-binding protein [Thiotrichales bacterium HSG14]
MKINYKIFLLSVIASLTFVGITLTYYFVERETIHIAFVAGKNTPDGKSNIDGIQLYLNMINQEGGINGRKVILDVFDDQNDPALAKQKALEIVEKNQVIAVIGHLYSSCSISGGEIYKENHIPAVTPFSTNVKVTQNNEWYFRTIFDDDLQSRFLANYVKNVFHQNTASIIHSNDAYGAYLAQAFSKTARNLGIEVKYQWNFQEDDVNKNQTLDKIVKELKANSTKAGIIFLATHANEGVYLVKSIKDLGIKNVMLGSDAFASNFPKGFEKFPKEQRNPGYYTDGLYVTTPLIFDSANNEALNFKEIYQTVYKKKVNSWHSAFAYDAAIMLVDAIKKSGISGLKTNLQADRQKLRDYLANNLTHIDNAVRGVAGFNYFDKQGNAQKPIFMGIYKQGTIVSAPIQFKDILSVNKVSNLEAVKDKRILQMNNKYMYKTNVVYTGIRVNEISEVDLAASTYTLDFYLWFRFKDIFDSKNIKFINAIKPVQLDEPIDIIIEEGMNYHLYHVKGHFKKNFMSKYHYYGLHNFGMSFHHRQLPRNQLVYVVDTLGMGLAQGSFTKKLQKTHVLNPKYNSMIILADFFQDIIVKDSLGNPKYLKVQDTTVEYSLFNMDIMAEEDELSLLFLIPQKTAGIILFLSIFTVILLLIMSQYDFFQRFFALIFTFKIISIFLLLLSSEKILVNWLMTPYIPDSYSEATIIIFSSLWWIIGAIFVHIAIIHFLWEPIEKKTCRPIPKLIRRLWVFIIYLLAIFGIIGFVFDRPLTSLLATSGVLAMIIGLAVKMNLSNIFSGLAIHLERPFCMGDWVKIGSYDEGLVEDVNWRATRICTRTGFQVIIPNSIVAASDISNFSNKENLWLRPTIYIDPRHPPEQVKKVLDEALLSVEGILKEPAPFTLYEGIENWMASYWTYICLEDYSKKFKILQSLWENVWAALDRAGIQRGIRRQEIYTFKGDKEKKWVLDSDTIQASLPKE